MHRPNKTLMFSMDASLLDVFARNEPTCRELRLPEETCALIRPLFWNYLCHVHFLALQQHSTCPKSCSSASRHSRHTPYAYSGFTLSSEMFPTSDVTRLFGRAKMAANLSRSTSNGQNILSAMRWPKKSTQRL